MVRRRVWIAGVLALGLAVMLIGAGIARAGEVPRMPMDELKAQLGKPEVIVLDVRAAGDWKSSDMKIQGAVREDPADSKGWIGKYPKGKTIVLYCA